MRSRNVMATMILQNISQLKELFKDSWEGIIGNADAFVYLGGNEQSTHKYVSELLGKETIETRTSSQSRGHNGSYSQNFQQAGWELLTPDEVRMLDNHYALALLPLVSFAGEGTSASGKAFLKGYIGVCMGAQ